MFIILFKYLRLQSQANRVQSYLPMLQYDASTSGRDNTLQTIAEMFSFNFILKLSFRMIGESFRLKNRAQQLDYTEYGRINMI